MPEASDDTRRRAPADVGARSHEAHERRGQLLLELAVQVTSTLDLQQVLDASLAAMRELVDFGGGAIQLIDGQDLVAAATDPPISEDARTVRIPVGRGVSGSIAATGEPVYIPDITADERVYPPGRERGVSPGVRSYFGVPLIVHGAPMGVLQIDAPQVDAFGPDARALVLAFVPTIAAAVQNAKLFEQERRIALQLRQAEDHKRAFLSIVSHELRTPLTTMMGFASTLAARRQQLTPEAAEDLTDRLVAAGERLERLVDDLLQASRVEHGLLELHVVPTPLPPLLAAVAGEWGGPPALELRVPPRLPLVGADPGRLRQVLANLLANAARFSPPEAAIELVAEDRHSHVAVSVRDRGPGIPVEIQQEVFGLFVQGTESDTRAAGGFGIGLYVVKRLCDAMEARVAVDSPPEGGATVTIELPVHVDAGRPGS